MNKFIFVITLPLLFIVGCACDNPPVIHLSYGLASHLSYGLASHLSYGLASHSTIDEIKWLVDSKGGSWEVIEHNTIGPGDSTINHGYLKVSATKLTKDFGGKLQLMFFNNKLAWIWGYPLDWSVFKGKMEERYKEKIFVGYEKTIDNYLIVRVHKDYKERIYVAWEDKCLTELQSSWIEKYS